MMSSIVCANWTGHGIRQAMRRLAAGRLVRRFGIDANNVLVINGCTEALDLVARWAGRTTGKVSLPSPVYLSTSGS